LSHADLRGAAPAGGIDRRAGGGGAGGRAVSFGGRRSRWPNARRGRRRCHVVGRSVATYDFAPVAEDSALGHRLTVATDVTDTEFLGWLHAADIVVDLRFPHRGEVSGTLARAMQVGRPSIVSATGTYLDAPPGTVVAVAPGPPDVAELAARIGELAGDGAARDRMGATARAYMDDLARGEVTAQGYADAIRSTIRVVHDPVGGNMRRWADALADVGVTGAEVADGYGLRFARALESFTHPS
jgi:hypothetical protein